MKVLVLGSGGREHAIAWRCGQEITKENVFLHPGNPGAEADGFAPLKGLASMSGSSIAAACRAHGIDLVVIGPEAFLISDLATELRSEGLLVVGPSAAGAKLESSKVFSKTLMERAAIPTAPFAVAESAEALMELAQTFPCALKYDGLAAGKGVVIAESSGAVRDFAHRVWTDREFGTPSRVLVEGFLHGREVSVIGFYDGESFLPLPSATDYKRVGDGDRGPNTGGMGAISPSPFETPGLLEKVQSKIVAPLNKQLRQEGITYRGILYIGLMVEDAEPWVLEFNARFGDPETQALMLRIEDGFVAALKATAEGSLRDFKGLKISPKNAVYLVAAAENYPAKPVIGDRIEGLSPSNWNGNQNTHLFFSAVQRSEQGYLTQGGRVLGVGALGPSLSEARTLAYDSLQRIRWRGMHYRRDIGLVK